MGLMRKIGAALRGSQHDALQAVVDSQAIRILEQEIRDCQASVASAKSEMAQIVAERTANQREVERLEQLRESLELQAIEALQAEDQMLAEHLVQQMADDERVMAEQRNHGESMQGMEHALRDNLLRADRQIRQHVQELRLARATEAAGKGAAAGDQQSSHLGEKLQAVQGSLQRIRERRQQADDMAAATRQVDRVLGKESAPKSGGRAGEILAKLKREQAS